MLFFKILNEVLGYFQLIFQKQSNRFERKPALTFPLIISLSENFFTNKFEVRQLKWVLSSKELIIMSDEWIMMIVIGGLRNSIIYVFCSSCQSHWWRCCFFWTSSAFPSDCCLKWLVSWSFAWSSDLFLFGLCLRS